MTTSRPHELTAADHRVERTVEGVGCYAMALENLIQKARSTHGFHAALTGPPHHIDDCFAAVADDINISGQLQLPFLKVKGVKVGFDADKHQRNDPF